MKRRGQAAMEFLMTYGWAILVVLVVIGALAYFGVLNPQSFLPQKCQFKTGLVCQDHVANSNGLTLRLNNGLGNDINVTAVTFSADNNQIRCTNMSSRIIPAGNSQNLEMNDCGSSMNSFSGTRVKGDMTLSYIDLQTQFSHNITGTLLTDVE